LELAATDFQKYTHTSSVASPLTIDKLHWWLCYTNFIFSYSNCRKNL